LDVIAIAGNVIIIGSILEKTVGNGFVVQNQKLLEIVRSKNMKKAELLTKGFSCISQTRASI
jgi:hypothetical protein